MAEYAFLNGQIVPAAEAVIGIHDIGILRAYGVFDFFRVVGGKPIFLDDYLDRFEKSAKGLRLEAPYTREEIKEAVLRLIELNYQPLLGIRLVCTGGYSPDAYTPVRPNVFMLARPFSFHPYNQGLKLAAVAFQRELHAIKSTNYLQPISMLKSLEEMAADDVLYHQGGFITESSRSNIFIVKNGILITPSHGMLEGITRKRILSFAGEIMPLEVRQVRLAEVFDADEVFLSASTKRISPVTAIDDVNYTSGPFTQLLYNRLLEEEGR
jgi:branched-subunit amino acid aminotransferase/4-amino-4-deoxychorismate lyase